VTTSSGAVVGRVQATTGDRVVPVNYVFTSGSDSLFALNPSTGQLTVNASTLYGLLDKTFTYAIRADYSGIFAKDLIQGCDCANRSDVYVNIHITAGPVIPTLTFPSTGYILCLSEDADAGDLVGSIRAISSNPSSVLTYAMLQQVNTTWSDGTKGTLTNLFELHPTGSGADLYVSANRTALRLLPSASSFVVVVSATDISNQPDVTTVVTNVTIVVTRPQYKVLVTLNQPPSAVRLDAITSEVAYHSNNGSVCIDAVKYHVSPDGTVNYDQTDIFLYVINGSSGMIVTDVTYHGLDTGYVLTDRKNTSVIGITMAYFYWHGFDVIPIAAAIGIIIGLLLIAMLLMCCCCCWGSLLGCCAGLLEDKEPLILHDGGVGGSVIGYPPMNPLLPRVFEDQHLTMPLGAEAMDYDNGAVAYALGGAAYDAGDGDVLQSSLSRQRLLTSGHDTSHDAMGNVRIEAKLSGSRSMLSAPAVTAHLEPQASSDVGATAAGNMVSSYETTTHIEERTSYQNEGRGRSSGYDTTDSRGVHRMPSGSEPHRAASRLTSGNDVPPITTLNETPTRGPARIGATLYQAPSPHSGFTATQRVVSTTAYPNMPDTLEDRATGRRPVMHSALPMHNEMTYNMHPSSVGYDEFDDYVSGGYPAGQPPQQQRWGSSSDGLYQGEIRLGAISAPPRRGMGGSTSAEQETRFM
jgi:hypothetical protein